MHSFHLAPQRMKLQRERPEWTQGSGKRTETCKEEICFERYHHSDFGNCLQAAGEESLWEVDEGHGELSGAPHGSGHFGFLRACLGDPPWFVGLRNFK